MKIVKIGGKEYLVGLSWETLSASEKIRDKFKEYRTGFYCARNLSGMVNIGYSDNIDGKYKKLPSLAAAVADAKKEPWCGIFKIKDEYWYIAVRDNQSIIPDADVIGKENDVEELFNNNLPLGWDVVIESGSEEDLLDLIIDVKSYVLKVNNPIYRIIIAVISILIFLLITHFIFFKKNKPKIIPFIPKIIKQVSVPKYKLLQEPVLMLNLCKEALKTAPVNYYGWKLINFICTDHNLTYVYRRQQFATAFKAPDGVLSDSGTQITVAKKLNIKKPSNFRKLLTQQKALKTIYGYTQEFNIKDSVQNSNNKFNLSLNLNTLDALTVFFAIPSFRIISITLNHFPDFKIIATAAVWYDK